MTKKEKEPKDEGIEVEKIKVIIDGQEFEAEQRTFSTGRKGYGLYARIVIKNYPHRISMNIIEM